MSHSTTATATHTLLKYSRSYPSQRSTSDDQGPDLEWQHFTNPIIRLVLEMKKSSTGDLESVRLRILWSIGSGQDSMDLDQNEVVFEDLDLLSFSSLTGLRHQSQMYQAQSLPLKAVYRDAIVGIRYLHPRIVAPESTPVFRRFQITFSTAGAASQFIEAISNVCPCKANSTPVQDRNMTINSNFSHSDHSGGAPSGSHLLGRQNSMIASPLTSTTSFSRHQVHRSSPLRAETVRAVHPEPPPMRTGSSFLPQSSENPGVRTQQEYHSVLLDSVSQSVPLLASASSSNVSCPPPSAVITSAPLHNDISSAPVSNRINPTELPLQIPRPNDFVPLPRTAGSNSSSVPDTSASSSMNSDPVLMPPPPPPSRALELVQPELSIVPIQATDKELSGNSHAAFISSLREVPDLYNLSRADLEEVVAHVIREEGFLQLLESLDSLWRDKGYLGR